MVGQTVSGQKCDSIFPLTIWVLWCRFPVMAMRIVKRLWVLILYLFSRCVAKLRIKSSSSDIKTLKTLSCDLLEDTFKEIRSHREKNSPANEEYFLTTEYLLEEAMEYADGSWEMLISGKPNASIALSRWIQ